MARSHLGASWANPSLAQSPASAKVAQQSRKPAGKNANNLSRKTTSDTWSPKIVTLHDVPIWDKCEAVQGLGDSKFSMGFIQKLTNKQMTYLLSYATGAAPMDRLLHHAKSTQFQMWTVMCQAKNYPLFHVASLEEALKAGQELFGEFGDPFTVEQDDLGNTFLCNGQTSAVLPESHYEWHCFQDEAAEWYVSNGVQYMYCKSLLPAAPEPTEPLEPAASNVAQTTMQLPVFGEGPPCGMATMNVHMSTPRGTTPPVSPGDSGPRCAGAGGHPGMGGHPKAFGPPGLAGSPGVAGHPGFGHPGMFGVAGHPGVPRVAAGYPGLAGHPGGVCHPASTGHPKLPLPGPVSAQNPIEPLKKSTNSDDTSVHVGATVAPDALVQEWGVGCCVGCELCSGKWCSEQC